jgi:hypothetical protein
MYDLMQEMHPKTLSCSVIAKGSQRAGEKFKRLTETINAAGEKGAPLHRRIKAIHDDVRSGAKSNVFPMDEIAHILMLHRWFPKSLDPDGKRTVSDVYKEVYMRSSMYYDLVVTLKDEGL